MICLTICCSVWDYNTGDEVNMFQNENERGSHINSMKFLNEHDISLLAVGSGMKVSTATFRTHR